MGDENCRPALAGVLESLLHMHFCRRVKRGSRLVQQQDRRCAQEHTSKGNPLTLSPAQPQPSFSQFSLVAVGEGDDPIVKLRAMRSVEDLLHGCFWSAVADVVRNALLKHRRVLRHDTDGPPQVPLRDVSEVPSIDGYFSTLRLVESEKEAAKCALATSRGSNNSHFLSGEDAQREILEDQTVLLVAKVDVLEDYSFPLAGDRAGGGGGGVFDFDRLIEKEEELFHLDEVLLDHPVQAPHPVEGRVELKQMGVDQDEVSDRHRPLQHPSRRVEHAGHETAAHDQLLDSIQHEQTPLRLDFCFMLVLQGLLVQSNLVVCCIEVLHGLKIHQRLDRSLLRLLAQEQQPPPYFHPPLRHD
mmetsp:Transcript_13612/g.47282  ORF Transcript_13612/g.47282 Transcript_13612/m.47282 type:complete len:357 (-) Transcript_13612:299-1369(-)